MERKDIDIEYTWDLSKLIESQEVFDKKLEEVKDGVAKLIAFKGKIATTKESFIEYMTLDEQVSRIMDQLMTFSSHSIDVEPNDAQMQQNYSAIMEVAQGANISLTFVTQELFDNKDKIDSYLSDEDCKDFRYPMDNVFRWLPHQRTPELEQMLAQAQEVGSYNSRTYTSINLDFKPVMVDGKEEFLSGGTYNLFLQNKDPEVRKQAFENYFGEYKKFANTFASTLVGHTKAQVFGARSKLFDTALDASLFLDGVERDLFFKVLDMANNKYQSVLYDFFQTRKDISGLEVQHTYDINIPLVDDVDITYSADEALDIIYEALSPLGEDYGKNLRRAKSERWIDFYAHKDKRHGAYSGGCYDSNPYILTNFDGTYSSMSTLAHELGHSMHSYYSRSNNRPMLAEYRIFVAEVASTVNEVLLAKHLLKTNDDKKYQAYILSNLLEKMVGTMYRQPMFAQFELDLNTWCENGTPLSAQTIADHYLELNKTYFGDAVQVDDLQGYGCFYIPHFYYNFYVYKYTLGMAVALSFATKILNGDNAAYLEFLTKGGSETPLEELINAGVDPRSDAVYDDAFTFFDETLQEFKALMK